MKQFATNSPEKCKFFIMNCQRHFVSDHGREITDQESIIESHSQPCSASAHVAVDLPQIFNLANDLFVTENQSKCPERRFWHLGRCHTTITEPGRQSAKESLLQTVYEDCLQSSAQSCGDIIAGQ